MGFSLIPSPGEIYPEALPAWAGPAKRPTDYDEVLARVRACGVAAVDLRPALIAAKREGLIYRRTDSHWTLLGAAFGYNAMLDAIGRPDWRFTIDPHDWYDRTFVGDLPAMAGLEPREERAPVERRFEAPALPRAIIPGLRFATNPPFVIEGKGPGPTLMVIGDSFTKDPMPPFFIDHVGRYAWIHHDECAFDWAIFDRVKPDLVLFAPAERSARCDSVRPLHMPAR
jgi:alginate O-acetyltransferase complex protein AlgJ